MTTQQPEALRLATELKAWYAPTMNVLEGAAEELLRLHAESELHQQELRSYRITVENREARIVALESRVQELKAEKARLIETYVPRHSATEVYMCGITQEKQGYKENG